MSLPEKIIKNIVKPFFVLKYRFSPRKNLSMYQLYHNSHLHQVQTKPIPMFNIGIVALFSGQKSGWSTNFILKDEQCYGLYRSGNLIMTNPRKEIKINFPFL